MKNLNFIFVFLFLFLANHAFGQDIIFTGTVNNQWENPANWNTGQVPGSSNYVYIQFGSVTLSSAVTVRNISVFSGASLTINSNGVANLRGDGAALNSLDIHGGGTVTNNGGINVMAANGDAILGSLGLRTGGATFTNNGTINLNVTNNYAIGLFDNLDNPAVSESKLINNACGKIIASNDLLNIAGSANTSFSVTNSGYMEFASINASSTGLFNSGVLKYASLTGTSVTRNNGSVVLTNSASSSTPIFTYTGTFTGTINGIFTNATATTSAGTFTAPNTFTPNSSISIGTNTLYAKVTPSGEACSYVVPFSYLHQAPIVGITGNSVAIPNGDTNPSTNDNRDFGSWAFNDGATTRGFVISNTGNVTLTLSGDPRVTITGGDADQFTVPQLPSQSISANRSSNFQIGFAPTSAGEKTAVVTIASNAPSSPQTFTVRGMAIVGEPAVRIKGNNVAIANGDDTPSTGDNTDFGELATHANELVQTFVIESFGTRSVTLTGDPKVTISGPNAADFSVTQQPAANIAVGSGSNLQIAFNPTSPGLKTALVTINSNDEANSSFTFAISGTGIETPGMLITRAGHEVETMASSESNPINPTLFGALATHRSLSVEFVIKNVGTKDLLLDGNPLVWKDSYPGYADFTITRQPSVTTIAPGDSTTFEIQFKPSTTSFRYGVFAVSNNDPAKNWYKFGTRGFGSNTAGIQVSGNETVIANHDSLPSASDHTDFGRINHVTGTDVTREFIITNIGKVNLSLTGTEGFVTLSGDHATDFTITQPINTTIVPEGQVPFSITFNPGGAGIRTAVVSIPNNETAYNPFTFTIQGEGVDPLAFIKHPQDVAACSVNSTSLTVEAKGADTYQWQVSTNNGQDYTDLEETANYTHVTSAELLITTASGLNGYRYRCIISGIDGNLTSEAATLEVWDCSGCKIAQPLANTTSILSSEAGVLNGVQTFTATCTGFVNSVTVYLGTPLELGLSEITLNMDAVGSSSGRVAAASGSNPQSGSLPAGPLVFTFDDPVHVSNGTLYQFSFTSSGSGSFPPVNLSLSGNSSYAGGRFSQNNGSTFSESEDLKFQVTTTEALPVRLVSFSGIANREGGVLLNWKTTDETGFDYFEVQRSSDTKSFEVLGKVSGYGITTQNIQTYQFTDRHPGNISYYRLKMVDQDGTFAYSRLISVSTDNPSVTISNAYPNPSEDGKTSVDIQLPQEAEWTISVFDLTGRIIHSEKKQLKAGVNKVGIQQLKEGVNLVRFENAGYSVVRKVIR